MHTAEFAGFGELANIRLGIAFKKKRFEIGCYKGSRMSDVFVLGVNVSHDSACALLKNGDLICAIAEERLNRIKHSSGGIGADGLVNKFLPHMAIRYCLDTAGIQLETVDLIVVSTCVVVNYNDYRVRNLTKEEVLEQLPDTLDPDRVEVETHHLSHAASAFYPSDFSDAVVLVADGGGSLIHRNAGKHHKEGWFEERITVYHGEENSLEIIDQYFDGSPSNGYLANDQHCSLGDLYQSATEFIGFERGDEGKTMGLAPYGSDCLFKDFSKAVQLKDGVLSIDDDFQFNKRRGEKRYYNGNFGPPRKAGEALRQLDKDTAASVQHALEKVLVELARRAHDKTDAKNICLSGGIALNSVANKIILDRTPFENIFVQPASGDDGCALGNALIGWCMIFNKPRKFVMRHSYLGRPYSHKEIESALNTYRRWIHPPKKRENFLQEVCSLLAQKKIMGWFQGGSEFGPRALGHRSILCDPRNPEMKDILNMRVKHREAFRPFAPSILFELVGEYFDLYIPSPYMLLVSESKKPDVIPAVTHVDDTGRVQTVTKEDNGLYYDLIRAFYEKTGVPVVLNTSFNDKDEPIVETPADALRTFLNTNIDYLVLGDWLVQKRELKCRLFRIWPTVLNRFLIKKLRRLLAAYPTLGESMRKLRNKPGRPTERAHVRVPG